MAKLKKKAQKKSLLHNFVFFLLNIMFSIKRKKKEKKIIFHVLAL
jgi:hypothetical protein